MLKRVCCRFPRGYDYSLQREDYESLSIPLQISYGKAVFLIIEDHELFDSHHFSFFGLVGIIFQTEFFWK